MYIVLFHNTYYLVKLPENSGALYKLKINPYDTNEVLEFKYISCKQNSPDTYIYTYEIPDNLTLGLNLGQHIAIEYYIFIISILKFTY